ncbi:MAG: RagB/SusD family nutrient uptake outer membrane protein [Bacteroidaceae bacterium]|nr:RagB/SusD family nutrient uptake outer membrane protein [Bacteroidaceae bacterium]
MLAALLGVSFTSCNDFLTLEPLNDIVLENFWTDKSDVESVLMGAYSALESEACLSRILIWGESRSDNMVEGQNTSEDIRQILRENLLITNDYCKYNAFYDAINRANTVLYYAPLVAEKDPNYMIDQVLAHQAEAVAIRCLSYWYLIRTFHDVPYVTQPSIDDEGGYEKFYVPQSSFEAILDSLISDLETVKVRANNKYATDDANVCRITKSTINAMLADMYLWRGRADDWQKCIDVCEEVTKEKLKDYRKILEKQGTRCTVALFNDYPLISDAPSDEIVGNAYNEIFGNGYSFESLFEFPYDNDVKNEFLFGNQQQRKEPFFQSSQSESNDSPGQVKAYDNIGSSYGRKDDVFAQKSDARYYEYLVKRNSSYAISKYAYGTVRLTFDNGSLTPYSSLSVRSASYCNWVIYRYSEVLLFEAEAYIQKAKALNPVGADSVAISDLMKEYKDKAFELIDAVNQRGILADNTKSKAEKLKDIVSYTNAMSVEDLEEILFQERRRELIFEGKRWYDLVRIARRDGNQDRLLRYVEKKHDSATLSAVKIRLKNPYAMYFPLHRDEVRNSKGVLKQNPAYRDDELMEQASH